MPFFQDTTLDKFKCFVFCTECGKKKLMYGNTVGQLIYSSKVICNNVNIAIF